MRFNLSTLVLAAAVAAGVCIAYVDTRPHWDDTGMTAGLLFLAALGLSFARPRLAVAIALLVGAWIPLLEIPGSGNTGSLAALVIALVGALCGSGVRRLVAPIAPMPTR